MSTLTLNTFLKDNKSVIEVDGQLDIVVLLSLLEFNVGSFQLKGVSVKNSGFTYYLLKCGDELFTLREWNCGYKFV